MTLLPQNLFGFNAFAPNNFSLAIHAIGQSATDFVNGPAQTFANNKI
jgi:hypothetical protein